MSITDMYGLVCNKFSSWTAYSPVGYVTKSDFKGTGTQKNRKKTIFFEFLDYTFFDYFEPSFTYISMLDKEFLR